MCVRKLSGTACEVEDSTFAFWKKIIMRLTPFFSSRVYEKATSLTAKQL